MTMTNYLTKQYKINSGMCDARNEVSPKCLLQIFQDLAAENANEMGFGWSALNKDGKVWVLSKISVEIYKAVVADQEVDAYTWPLAPDRFFADREFIITDKFGNKLVAAYSRWCLLDTESRTVTNAEALKNYYGGEYLTQESGADRRVEKIFPTDDFVFVYDKTVRWSDLDLNGHVNNTNYAAYAVDACGSLFDRTLKKFELTYACECRLGEVIAVKTIGDGNTVKVLGEKDGKTCFTAKLIFV
ncbi:MAG: thioesterase [Corallococcus sp.]|nr:thioesterase [Corallococcus sp.]